MRGTLLKWTQHVDENLFDRQASPKIHYLSERGDVVYQTCPGHWYIKTGDSGPHRRFKHPWAAIRAVEAELRDPLSEFTRKVNRS